MSHSFNVIRGHISNVINGLRPVNLKDYRIKSGNDKEKIKGLDVVRQYAVLFERRVQSSTRARKAQVVTRQTNTTGRSMIEMLGVLAIIAVLSVGGIAGYSKAMEKFRINKLLYEYNTLIMGLLEHRENIIKSIASKSGTQYLTQFTVAANISPTNWELQSNHFKDSFDNEVYPYAEETYSITNDIKRVGVIIGLNSASSKNTKAKKLCVEMFSNLIIPLKSFIQRGYVYKSNKDLSDTLYMGDKYCQNSSKCLRDMTLNDMHNICNDCDTNANCQIIISF